MEVIGGSVQGPARELHTLGRAGDRRVAHGATFVGFTPRTARSAPVSAASVHGRGTQSPRTALLVGLRRTPLGVPGVG